MESFKYLGVNITQDLTWSCHINTLVKKARQRLYCLRRLRDFKLPFMVLRNFYTCTIESILAGSITTWMGSTTQQDFLALRRVVRWAEAPSEPPSPTCRTSTSNDAGQRPGRL